VVIALLALLGVPLWFCAIAISVLLLRNRSLRKRRGNIPARIRMAPGKRWIRGHGLWVHDVWAFRGSPAAWNEKLVWVTGAHVRATTDEEAKKLHRLDERPVIAMLQTEEGTIEIAGEPRITRFFSAPTLRAPTVGRVRDCQRRSCRLPKMSPTPGRGAKTYISRRR
jgi:hypothetical protein